MENYKYLYIHKFGWLDEQGTLDFDGEPKSNTVYKADEEEYFYKISLQQNQEKVGIAIQKDGLICDGEDGESWTCEIEVVTSENLFDLNISEQDLSMMANEVSHKIGFNPEGLNKVLMSEMKDALLDLKSFDVEMFEAMTSITTLMSKSMTSSPYITITDGLAWHPRSAKISAVSNSVMCLQRYINDEEDDTNEVLEAIFIMITELMRQHKLHRHDMGL